jgi:hypothetical protein
MGTLALTAVALRCYSKLTITAGFGYDDGLMLAAGVVLASLMGMEIAGTLSLFLAFRFALT